MLILALFSCQVVDPSSQATESSCNDTGCARYLEIRLDHTFDAASHTLTFAYDDAMERDGRPIYEGDVTPEHSGRPAAPPCHDECKSATATITF